MAGGLVRLLSMSENQYFSLGNNFLHHFPVRNEPPKPARKPEYGAIPVSASCSLRLFLPLLSLFQPFYAFDVELYPVHVSLREISGVEKEAKLIQAVPRTKCVLDGFEQFTAVTPTIPSYSLQLKPRLPPPRILLT